MATVNWCESKSLYCCGGPGTGKTVTITAVAAAAKQWAQGNKNEIKPQSANWDHVPKFAFVNVAHLVGGTVEGTPKQRILAAIGKSIGEADTSLSSITAKLSKKKGGKKKMCFLVLDEMDLLTGVSGGEKVRHYYFIPHTQTR